MAETQNATNDVNGFEKMKGEGVPKAEQPTTVAVPKEQSPKLTAKEFQVYNHMAEHMDMFVRTAIDESAIMAAKVPESADLGVR